MMVMMMMMMMATTSNAVDPGVATQSSHTSDFKQKWYSAGCHTSRVITTGPVLGLACQYAVTGQIASLLISLRHTS